MTSDKLFKLLIRFPSRLRAMIEWILPNLAPLIDFGYIEFIDKERISVDGKKREGDVLVKTRFVGQEETTFLFHLENQGQVRKDLPDRMLEYLPFMFCEGSFAAVSSPFAVQNPAHPQSKI